MRVRFVLKSKLRQIDDRRNENDRPDQKQTGEAEV